MSGGFLPGTLVSINGVTGNILVDGLGEQIDFNGAKAQLVEFEADEGKWRAVTFDGYMIYVASSNVKLLTATQLDGFDLVMGPKSDPDKLALQMVGLLQEKAFFTMNAILSDSYREELLDVAKTLDSEGLMKRLPNGFEEGYLGKGGKGKAVSIDLSSPDTPAFVSESPLKVEDENINVLCEALGPHLKTTIGQQLYSRTSIMLAMPFVDLEDEADYPPHNASVAEADSFLKMMGRKCMGMLHFVGPSGGEVTLVPKVPLVPELTFEAKPNMMLMFLASHYTYSFKAAGECLTMLSYFLDYPLEYFMAAEEVEASKPPGVRGIGAPPPLGKQIMIEGLASRDPMEVTKHEDYWQAVRFGGCDGFLEIPYTRFDIDVYVDYTNQQAALMKGQSYCRHQGHIEGIECFDPQIFSIPDNEALGMDPQQRVILEVSLGALHEGGYDKAKLQRESAHMGAFIGISGSDWMNCAVEFLPGVNTMNGMPETFIANRVNFALNLKGPSYIVNTACSASLVSTHAAKTNLQIPFDPLEGAITCGINLNISPGTWIGNCGSQMLSFIGRCLTFNSTADGYGRGEGSAGALLKLGNLTQNKNAYACMAGSHANSDGRSASLTAPNGPAQQRLLRAVLEETNLKTQEIDCYEAHGTGTTLGDPIEFGAMRKVLQKRRDYPTLCTCAKTNTGHMEGGAGLSGFMKCVLMTVKNECAPVIHQLLQNPHLDVDGFPCQILDEALGYKNASSYCGVSSFGYGGTNGHCMAYGQYKPQHSPKKVVARKQGAKKAIENPDITMESTDYEEWSTTGMPFVDLYSNKDFHIDKLPNGKTLWREVVTPELSSNEGPFFIQGSFNDWDSEEMDPSEMAGLFTCEVTIGASGQESFNVLVENDPDLIFFPMEPNCTRKSVKVNGPSSAPSNDYAWVIKGKPGAQYRVEFFASGSVATVNWIRTSTGADE